MSQSLDKSSSNLTEDRFIYTGEEIDGDLHLMKKKGVYPYDYMDSLSETGHFAPSPFRPRSFRPNSKSSRPNPTSFRPN